jgi:Lantibiotic dehydratase, N terminus
MRAGRTEPGAVRLACQRGMNRLYSLMNGGCSPSGHWHVSPPVVRTAGLPASVLDDLRFEESARLLVELVAQADLLESDAKALSDDLYEVVGELEPGNVKAGLVGLRRTIFQRRAPNPREWNPAVADGLPAGVSRRVADWIGRLEGHQRLQRDLPAVLASEKQHKKLALRQVSGDPRFRRALSHASPALSQELEKWLADDQRQPKPQPLTRLARYVARAAAKTSPYSTFMVTGTATWSDHGPAVRPERSAEPRAVLEIDGIYLQAVRRALARRGELAAAVRVRANPSLARRGEAVEFIGHPPSEPIVMVGLTPGLASCLELAGEDGRKSVAELRAGLRAAGADDASAERFVLRLVEMGLLELYIPVADQSPEPMGDLARWLTESLDAGQAEGLAEIRRLLWDLHRQLSREVPVADLDGQRRRLADLHLAMRALAGQLGLPAGVAGETPKSVIHETAVAPGPVAVCSLPRWRPALDDLDVVRRWLTIFEPELPMRLALGTFFAERFGAGGRADFGTLYRAIQEQLARPRSVTPAAADLTALLRLAALPHSLDLSDRQLARLRQVEELRAEARQAVLREADSDGIVRVDPVDLAKQVANWPSWIRRPGSVACYAQAQESAAGLRLVLNTVHAGNDRALGRLRQLMRRAGVPMWERDAPRAPGPAFAELSGLHGSTLNLRSASAAYEIDYPFTVSGRPESERLALAELVAVHDVATDSVSLVAGPGLTAVIPLHLGVLSEYLLPPAARFLVQAFGPPSPAHLASPLFTPSGGAGTLHQVIRAPRLEVGHVVLRRARWFVPVPQVPAQSAGETDARYAFRLTAWLRRHEIPDRCFARVWEREVNMFSTNARKPVYIDFTNWFSVAGFGRQIKMSETVMFEEAFPVPGDVMSCTSPDGSVTEFLVEISDATAAADAGGEDG